MSGRGFRLNRGLIRLSGNVFMDIFESAVEIENYFYTR